MHIYDFFLLLQMSDKTHSKVWDCFTKGPTGEAVCNACAASLSQGSSRQNAKNTTNLWQHLRLKHNEAYVESQRQALHEAQRKAEALVPMKNYQHQPTLAQVFDRNKVEPK